MTKEHFELVMDGIDATLIEEAAMPNTKKRKINILKVGTLVASMAMFVSVGILIFKRTSDNTSQNLTDNFTVESTANDTTSSNICEPINDDVIYWNNSQILNTENRLAGRFIETTKEEWMKYYNVELSDNYEIVYRLVYTISKPNEDNDDKLMCGFIGLNLSENVNVDIYVDDNSLHTSDNIFIHDFDSNQLEESQINGRKIYLGEYESNRCAVFNDGKYSYYIKMYNMNAEQSIELLKDILK